MFGTMNNFFKKMKGGVALASLLASLVFSGCSTSTGGSTARAGDAQAAVTRKAACDAPVRVGLLGDKTLSTAETRTQQLQAEDLDVLVNLISRCGGEIGVGLVTDDSNRSLSRLRIETPEPEPAAPQLKGKSAFEAAREQDAYRKKKADYELELAAWQKETVRRKEHFAELTRGLLAQEPNYARTDVWDAVRRAELFMAENGAGWPRQPHGYIVIVSDGEDNVRKPSVTINSGAQLLLVNGNASVGALAHLNPLRFESLDAALQYIVATEGGSK
jgi:hypothetical protein